MLFAQLCALGVGLPPPIPAGVQADWEAILCECAVCPLLVTHAHPRRVPTRARRVERLQRCATQPPVRALWCGVSVRQGRGCWLDAHSLLGCGLGSERITSLGL